MDYIMKMPPLKNVKEIVFGLFVLSAVGVIFLPWYLTHRAEEHVELISLAPEPVVQLTEIAPQEIVPREIVPQEMPKVVAPPPVVVHSAGWVIRVGTFSVPQNAEKLADKLKRSGMPAYTKTKVYAGKSLTLVMVGPHPEKSLAQEKQAEIEKQYGLKGQLLQEEKT
jgi:cell division septation protein DedD